MSNWNHRVIATEQGDHLDIMSFNKNHGEDRSSGLRRMLSTQSPKKAMESQRLFMDNLKLWDCLALVRSDVSLSCQSAINLIFSLSNNDYLRAFPDALQFIHAHFAEGQVRYSSAEEAAVEDLRLRQENIRLHAAVWVLRDNPGLQPDSALAAIFRLDDETFKNKFPIDYDSCSLEKLTSYTSHNLDNTASCSNKRNNRKTREYNSNTPRPRSASTKRKTGAKTAGSRVHRSPPASQMPVSRRSSSTWGREDFTSNRIPTVSGHWDIRHSPDPPLTITHGVRSQFKRSNQANRSFNIGHKPMRRRGNKSDVKKRSPSAMGRIEGQSDSESDDEAEVSQSAARAREELHRCTAQLGLEVNNTAGVSHSKVKDAFVDALYDTKRSRYSKHHVAKQEQNQEKNEGETNFHPNNSMKFFCPINPDDWPEDAEPRKPRYNDQMTSNEVRAAIREILDQSELTEPQSKKLHPRHQLANKHLNPDASLNKSSNNRHDLVDDFSLDKTSNSRDNLLFDASPNISSKNSYNHLDNAGFNKSSNNKNNLRYGQDINSLHNPDRGDLACYQQKRSSKVRFVSPIRSPILNKADCKDLKDRLPDIKPGSKSGTFFGNDWSKLGDEEPSSSNLNTSANEVDKNRIIFELKSALKLSANDANRNRIAYDVESARKFLANDMNRNRIAYDFGVERAGALSPNDENRNRIAYDVDSAGNVSRTDNWLCSFTDQSLRSHQPSEYYESNQFPTQRFCLEDRSEFKLGLFRSSHVGLTPDRSPSVQIFLSNKAAQHPIGSQYPFVQPSSVSSFLSRHRRMQDRFGDPRSKPIFKSFEAKNFKTEFPVFANFNSPYKTQASAPTHDNTEKSQQQQQKKMPKDKPTFQHVKIQVVEPPKPVGKPTKKLDNTSVDMVRQRALSEIKEVSEDEEGSAEWGRSLTSVMGVEQRVGNIKGCERPGYSKRHQGLALLRNMPKTKITSPLQQMIQRNVDKKPWTVEQRYRETTLCHTNVELQQPVIKMPSCISQPSSAVPTARNSLLYKARSSII